MSRAPRIALVFCPYFSIRSPHLGLSRVYTVLRAAGYSPDVFDLDTLLKDTDRPWYNEYIRTNNIGHEFDRVTFILGLEVLLQTLFGDDEPAGQWEAMLASSPIRPVPGFHRRVEEAADRLLASPYDLYLFSTYSSNLLFSLLLACGIKKRSHAPIVFGGPGSGIPQTREFMMRAGLVDAVVVGEGEATIVDLLDKWTGEPTLPHVPGVASIDGSVMVCEPRPLLDLDSLPFTVFPDSPQGYAPVETTRGCTMRCAFCSESQYWHEHRARSVSAVVEELASLTERHGALHVEFVDSLVNPSPARLDALNEGLIQAALPVEWTCDMRAVPWMTAQRAEAAYRAGCRVVNIGAETFIPRALTALSKGTRVEWILDTIRALSGAGIMVTVHRMCCVCAEEDHEVLEMYDTLREFRRSIQDAGQWSRITWGAPDIMRVEPYSPMFRDPTRGGIRLEPFHLPLPSSASHLRESLDTLCIRWSDGVSRGEKLRRHALMRRLDRVTGLVPH